MPRTIGAMTPKQRRDWAQRAVLVILTPFVLTYVLHTFLFHPTTDVAPAITEVAERARYRADDGTALEGWWVPARGASRGALVFFHGNAENASDHGAWAQHLSSLGIDVLLAEYRGYGGSEGSPSARGIERDAEAAIRYLRVERAVDLSRLVVHGHSLGGAAAMTALAGPASGAAGGIVASTFTSLHEMASQVIGAPLTYLVPDGYALDSAARAPRVRAPVLHLHGDRDEVIPFAMGERLDALLPHARFVRVRGGTHNHDDPSVTRAILAFLDEVIPPR